MGEKWVPVWYLGMHGGGLICFSQGYKSTPAGSQCTAVLPWQIKEVFTPLLTHSVLPYIYMTQSRMSLPSADAQCIAVLPQDKIKEVFNTHLLPLAVFYGQNDITAILKVGGWGRGGKVGGGYRPLSVALVPCSVCL